MKAFEGGADSPCFPQSLTRRHGWVTCRIAWSTPRLDAIPLHWTHFLSIPHLKRSWPFIPPEAQVQLNCPPHLADRAASIRSPSICLSRRTKTTSTHGGTTYSPTKTRFLGAMSLTTDRWWIQPSRPWGETVGST